MAVNHKIVYSKLKNHELKVLLQVRDLCTDGSKIEMAARLIKHDMNEAAEQKASAARVATTLESYQGRALPDSNIGTSEGGGQAVRGDGEGLGYDDDGLPNFTEEGESSQSIYINKAKPATKFPEVPSVTTKRDGEFDHRPDRKKRKFAHADAVTPVDRTPTTQTPSLGHDGSGNHFYTDESIQSTNTNAEDREQGAEVGEMPATMYTMEPEEDLGGQNALYIGMSVLFGAVLAILTVIMYKLLT